MKYYPYSVKERLAEYFGTEPVAAMRKPRTGWFGPEDEQNLLPLSWQYADELTVELFLGHRFLVGTSIEDDYIAYRYQQGDRQCVLLMFMLYEEEAPFTIDIGYADAIVREWVSAGYDTKNVSQCIAVERYRNRESFRLVHHVASGLGTHMYEVVENAGKPIIVFHTHRCWPFYYEKLLFLSKTNDLHEYECLFEPDVVITSGDGEDKKAIDTGFEAAADFLHKHAPVRVCYIEFRNTGIYNRCLMAGENTLDIWVNARNLITEINFSSGNNIKAEECDSSERITSLVGQVPELRSVRALDVTQIHGYAVQLSYSDESVRNFYIKMFEEPRIPDSVLVDSYVFDEQTLKSPVIKENGIAFGNGYTIAAHILFYRSYRQLVSSAVDRDQFFAGNGVLEPKYCIPLKEFKSHFKIEYYWGKPDECHGPADALLNRDGERIMDASFLGAPYWEYRKSRVRTEPTGRYGFLRKDGTWLATPIYEYAEDFSGGFAKVKRKVNGELKEFLLTEEGIERTLPIGIDIGRCDEGLCPFNAAAEPVTAPRPGYYWDEHYDDVIPGKWGYMDMNGNVVVEPQYVYVVGFFNEGDAARTVVAKMDGGRLLWGAIDTSGREVVPCRYESLYTRWGDAFAFRREGEKVYGIMDINGSILVEPRFEYFEEYNAEHRLLTVGEHGDALGVYSLDKERMIIPEEYDCVEYGEKIIFCEPAYTCSDRCFDYDGNELDFLVYDRVSEKNGLLRTWKDGKAGYIRMDGTVIVPNILGSGSFSAGNDEYKLFQKGYIITGERKEKGLAFVDGREILPPRYAEIMVYDNFVVASERTERNWCIRDTMTAFDGTPILKGLYRRIEYDRERGEVYAETPSGKVFFSYGPET